MLRVRITGRVTNCVTSCVIAVAACLTVTGCGSDNGPSGGEPRNSPSPSPSPSTSTSTSEGEPAAPSEVSTATPGPSAPALPEPVNSRAGRKAFAEHVLEVWSYAIGTNDAKALLALSPEKAPCDGCEPLQGELRQRTRTGWYVDFPGATVRSVTVTGGPVASVARMAISIPESQAFNDDGSFRSNNPAHPKATFEVRMRFVRGGYHLLSFTVST